MSGFCFPDWCSASGGDCAQNSGVDVHAFLTEPAAASPAAVIGLQGFLQARCGPHPHQQRRCSLPDLIWKTGTFYCFHSVCGYRGARGKWEKLFSPELAHFFFPLASSPFQSTPSHRAEFSSHFPSAATNLSLTCSSCLLLVFSSFLSLLFLLSSLWFSVYCQASQSV